MVLLPQGKIINNPDTVKLVNILPTTLGKESFFVVIIKLDDDSELMLERCSTRMEAERVADQCCRLLNGEEMDDVPSFVEDSSSGIDEPSEDASSDWDDESSEEVNKPENESKTSTIEEDSSSWGMSSEESAGPQQAKVEEESSSWGMSSEDTSPAPSKKTKASKKPVIQEPYKEAQETSSNPKDSKKKKSAVKMKSMSKTSSENKSKTPLVEEKQIEPSVPKQMPRVTSFIEGDSDEWIPDNGLDDWYE